MSWATREASSGESNGRLVSCAAAAVRYLVEGRVRSKLVIVF
jgi:hypothetical protein